MKSKSLLLASALSLLPLTSMGVDKEKSVPPSYNWVIVSNDAPQSGKASSGKTGTSQYDGLADSAQKVGSSPIAPNQQPKSNKDVQYQYRQPVSSTAPSYSEGNHIVTTSATVPNSKPAPGSQGAFIYTPTATAPGTKPSPNTETKSSSGGLNVPAIPQSTDSFTVTAPAPSGSYGGGIQSTNSATAKPAVEVKGDKLIETLKPGMVTNGK